MSCRNSSAVSAVWIVREIALNPLLFLAAERRICEDHVNPILLADFGQLEAQRVAGVDVRRIQAVQQKIHLAQQIWQRLRLAAEQRLLLQQPAMRNSFHLLAEMVVGLDQKAPGAGSRVKHGFTETWIGDLDHEAHDRARCVELT
jgi:hypothetical protein